jgi:Spy/CpxP family protein refolding chaperone
MGMGIVPPGTWWKNPDTITALSLSADQQKKMDDMFLQSRIALIHLHATLEEEQLKLEPLLNVNPPDQSKALAQISKIADLRADLEKANAKMLLGLRSVLTAEQWTKLQAQQNAHRDHAKDDHRPDRAQERGRPGPQGSQGPRGQNGPQNGPPPPAAPDVE